MLESHSYHPSAKWFACENISQTQLKDIQIIWIITKQLYIASGLAIRSNLIGTNSIENPIW